ncbi:baeRF3 domain-containing protein [Streptomyces diastaticus]|uniref:baeRF3 domain-containing protein n=1 Tax=Streptomyces diastaticus TaxID=1956 RepID=UPI00344C119F
MHTSELTPAVLKELRRPRPYPAVSLLMPTHRARPERDQDFIRLRNLLSEARKRLREDPQVERDARLELEGKLSEETFRGFEDIVYAGDGLLLLVSPGEELRTWQLTTPVEVPTRIVFSDTYLTRSLVSARLHARPYYVLVLDQEMCRLWIGEGERLTEVEDHGFPAPPQIPDPEDAVPGPLYGRSPSAIRDERLRQYMSDVDERLSRALDAQPLPLFVVGGVEVLSRFDATSRHASRPAGRVELAGQDTDSGPKLSERLVPAREKWAGELVRQDMAALDDARSAKRFAGGLPEVWTMVAERRVSLLLVEENFAAVGHIDEAGGLHLREVPEETEPPLDVEVGLAAETDIVDTLIETALDGDAQVRFVPDGTLAEDGGVAAVVRY